MFHPSAVPKVIDWQLLGYKDPTFDLRVAIVSNIPESEMKMESVMGYIKHYYETFGKEVAKAGCPEVLRRDWEKFSEFCISWGMVYTLLWFVNPFASNPFSNVSRCVKIYEFLSKEMKVGDFLREKIQKEEI